MGLNPIRGTNYMTYFLNPIKPCPKLKCTVFQVLTKPAEMAKQHMSKRCQDLVSIMESLMEDKPKIEDQLRLDLQDPDNSYYVSKIIFLQTLDGQLAPVCNVDSIFV